MSAVRASPQGSEIRLLRHEHLHPVGATIGEQLGVAGPSSAEDRDHTPQGGLGAGAHVQWLDRQPHRIHPDQRSISRSQAAQEAAPAMGQRTRTWTGPRCRGVHPIAYAEEAAQAGERGRGLAAVAAEGRVLAGCRAEAASEIDVVIGLSVDQIERG